MKINISLTTKSSFEYYVISGINEKKSTIVDINGTY